MDIMMFPILSTRLCFFNKIMKKIARRIITRIPIKIITLLAVLNSKKIPGKKINVKKPIVTNARVYIVRFKIKETVTSIAETPSLYIKYALAG